MKSHFYTSIVVFLTLSLPTGCSLSHLLVGTVDPVDQKSQNIQAVALETLDPAWRRVDLVAGVPQNDAPDRAWQSVKTASVISLNSACNGATERELSDISNDLLTQWRDLENITQKEITISGLKALETTAEGFYFNRKRKFQTVVVKTPTCVYDLIFLSPTKTFLQDLAVFKSFRDKLNIK